MAATIKTTLTDNSKEWVEELKANFLKAGGSADGFEKHLEDLNGELQSREAAKAAKAIKALADEFEQASPMARALGIAEEKVTEQTKRMSKALDAAAFDADAATKKLDRYRAAAERAGSVKSGGGSGPSAGSLSRGVTAQGVTAVATSATALGTAMRSMALAAKLAYEYAERLSSVSPAYAKLKESMDGVVSSALKAGQRFAATDFGARQIAFATSQMEAMSKRAERLPTLFQDMNVSVYKTMTGVQEWLGMDVAANHKLLAAMKEVDAALDARVLLLQKEAEATASNARFVTVQAANAKEIADAEVLASIARLTDRNSVIAAIIEEGHALERKRKAGVLTDEAARASISKTAALRAQLRKVEADEENKWKVRQDARKAQFEADEAARVAKIKQSEAEITANELKEIEARKAAFDAALQQKFEAAKAAQQAANQLGEANKQAAAEKLAKGAQEHKGSAEYLLQNQGATAVARQVAKQRGDEAMEVFGVKNRKKYQEHKKASESIADEIKGTDDPTEKKRLMEAKQYHDKIYKGIAKERRDVGAKARQDGFRDVVQGNVTGDEVAEAQSRLAKNVIDHGESTGRLNKSQAETLRAATDVLLAQQAEQRRLVEELGATKDTLRKLLFNGNGHNKGQQQGY